MIEAGIIKSEKSFIKNPEIGELREPLEKIARMIIADKKEKAYDLIIGDDTSGRIPTLVLGRVLNAVRYSEGLEAIPIRFVGGGRSHRETIRKELIDVLKRIKAPSRRVLLVTDYIHSGWTIATFGDVFKRRRINYDIASIAAARRKEGYGYNINKSASLYLGKELYVCPAVHRHCELTGLEPGVARNKRVQYIDWPSEGRGVPESGISKSVVEARQDVKILAGRILASLFNQSACFNRPTA